MSDKAVLEARAAFVAFIKEENADREAWARETLKRHWRGAVYGFNHTGTQNRWEDFLAGWRAAAERNQ